jgi:hypothetical protein
VTSARRPTPGRRAVLVAAVILYAAVARARRGHLRYQRDFYRQHLLDMGKDPDL